MPSSDKIKIPEKEVVRENSQPYIVFRYQGEATATFTGAVTGKSYRFNFNGDTRMVDYRDSGAMVVEPLLKQIILH